MFSFFQKKNLFLHEYLHINELVDVWCVPEGHAKLPSRLSGWRMVMVTLPLDHLHWMLFLRLIIDNDGSFLGPQGPPRVLLIPIQQNHTRNQKKTLKTARNLQIHTRKQEKQTESAPPGLHIFTSPSWGLQALSVASEVYPWEPYLPTIHLGPADWRPAWALWW